MKTEMFKKGLALNINEIFLLDNLFEGSDNYVNMIRTYFKKKSHKSRTTDFRENSEKWLDAVKEDEEIQSLPDYDVKRYGTLAISHDLSTAILTIMSINVQEFGYDGDTFMVERFFVVGNQFNGDDLCTSLRDLLGLLNVMHLLRKSQEELLRKKVLSELNSFENEVFYLLEDKIVKAMKNYVPVRYLDEYKGLGETVIIGDEIFGEEEMTIITRDYKSRKKFYDQNDEVIGRFSFEDYVDFHRKHRGKE